ncbi:MAG: hypothetical protein ABH840_00560 [Nanoarchaeota archaeon]
MSDENNKWKEIREKDYFKYLRDFGNMRLITVKSADRKNINEITFRWCDSRANLLFQGFYFEKNSLEGWCISGEERDFDDRKPFSEQYKSLPDDRPPIPQEYKISFNKLAEQAPTIKESLEKCIRIIDN